jgi:hypothetical protein
MYFVDNEGGEDVLVEARHAASLMDALERYQTDAQTVGEGGSVPLLLLHACMHACMLLMLHACMHTRMDASPSYMGHIYA